MPRKAPPLTSFAPELKQAWVEAATREVKITLPSRQSATSLRHRLYKLRTALAEAGDPLFESAQYATIRILPEASGLWTLVLEPADSAYKHALAAAGLGAPEAPMIDFGLGDGDKDETS